MKYYIEFKDRWYDLEDLPNEIWLPISGYEGLYEISNYGRVKSLGNNKSNNSKLQIFKQYETKKGYLRVYLSKKYERNCFFVHRLVAQAFLPNLFNEPQVNHRDEDKHNNHVDNLEWCDNKYNCNYGTYSERVSKKLTNGKLSKPVLQYDLEGNFIAEFPSTNEIQRQFGYPQSNISLCCCGIRKTCGGYIWKYK